MVNSLVIEILYMNLLLEIVYMNISFFGEKNESLFTNAEIIVLFQLFICFLRGAVNVNGEICNSFKSRVAIYYVGL